MERNLALEFVRVTEAGAIASAKWMGKGDNDAAGLSQAQAADNTPRSAIAERAAGFIDRLNTAAAAREFAAKVESVEAPHYGKTVVDGLGCGFGERLELMSHVVEQAGFIEARQLN